MALFKVVNGVSVQMTPSEETAFLADQAAATTANNAKITAHTTALNSIKTTAQSTVGVTLTTLTATQVRSLLAILLYNAGAIDVSTLTIKPLTEWIKINP